MWKEGHKIPSGPVFSSQEILGPLATAISKKSVTTPRALGFELKRDSHKQTVEFTLKDVQGRTGGRYPKKCSTVFPPEPI